MDIIPQINAAMHTLLTTTTEAIAAAQQYVKCPDRAKFCPSTLVQTLVYGWLAHPTATVEQLAQMAYCIGVDVSPQAVDQRFTNATADLLQAVLMARHPAWHCHRSRGDSDSPALVCASKIVRPFSFRIASQPCGVPWGITPPACVRV